VNRWDLLNGVIPGIEVRPLPDRAVSVEICYPRNDDVRVNTVEIGLMDVRATDSIRITYDFKRDGWSILQAAGWNRDQADGGCGKPEYENLSVDEKHQLSERIMDWQEVAFVQAWARVPPGEMDQ
jgi:hypothetical protein